MDSIIFDTTPMDITIDNIINSNIEINNNIINEQNNINNILSNIEHSVKNKIKKNDRYLNVLDALGLNINITYPIKVIIDTIIELHVTTNGHTKNSYIRNYKFKTDINSRLIKENLDLVDTYYLSYIHIKRSLHKIFRNYKYDLVINTINIKESVNTLNNQIIGFNYDNPNWKSLEITIL